MCSGIYKQLSGGGGGGGILSLFFISIIEKSIFINLAEAKYCQNKSCRMTA